MNTFQKEKFVDFITWVDSHLKDAPTIFHSRSNKELILEMTSAGLSIYSEEKSLIQDTVVTRMRDELDSVAVVWPEKNEINLKFLPKEKILVLIIEKTKHLFE